MPYVEVDNIMGRVAPASGLRPTYKGWHPQADNSRILAEYSTALRTAFAFLRRHGDRRYSASSLMKLLNAADSIDAYVAQRESGAFLDFSTIPYVATAEVPFTYDEETEVKSGGVLTAAVVLPDGRMMVAVHTDKRRSKLGTAMQRFVQQHLYAAPAVWVHQANIVGQQFCLANGLMPWEVNTRGAVCFAIRRATFQEEDLAVLEASDSEIDEMVRMNQRRARSNRVPRSRIRGAVFTQPAVTDWLNAVDEPSAVPGQVRYHYGQYNGMTVAEAWERDPEYVRETLTTVSLSLSPLRDDVRNYLAAIGASWSVEGCDGGCECSACLDMEPV